MPVKDSDMQKAEMDFLRAMKGYAENEEEKDENDVFGVLIATELKKLSKKKQIMTKRKIQNLIFDMQMEMKSHNTREIILAPTDHRLTI